MKLSFNFQTLILLTLTSLLVVATAVWGAVVYQSIYAIILHGFDQKLLALSSGAAEFTDGDGHARYQQPRQILSMTAGSAGQLLAFDATRSEVVSIDPSDGGALAYAAADVAQAVRDSGMVSPRAIAFDAASGRIALLSGDGLGIAVFPANPMETPPLLSAPADGLLFIDGVLVVRRASTLVVVGSVDPLLNLAEPVSVLALAPPPASFVGLASTDSALLWFDATGAVQRRLALDWGDHEISGLAAMDTALYATAASLLRVDLDQASVVEDFAPGYFSERDPYFERFATPYRKTREAAGLTFLYTDVHLGGDQIRYILDGSTGDDHSPPGTLDVVPEESVNDVTLAQSRGQAFVSDIREWEEWGLIKIAAEPIYSSNGQIVALAGADVDIGLIREKTRFALFSVIFVGAALLLLAGSVSYRVSQSLMRPLRDIKDSALRIAAGYHGTRVAYESTDEIGQLAQSLNTLSSRLAAQARQSQAYQSALTNGREQIALEHALGDLLIAAQRDLPPGMHCAAVPSDYAAYGSGELGLCWRLQAYAPALTLEPCIDHARIQHLAKALLQQNEAQALDTLFLTLPTIAWVAAWDHRTQTVTFRSRAPFVVHLQEAGGDRTEREGFDGMQLSLTDSQRLELGGGQIVIDASPGVELAS